MDVVKTKVGRLCQRRHPVVLLLTPHVRCDTAQIATGVLDRNLGILGCLREVAKSDGVLGLYSGLQGRIVWSMLFSAIGFTSFEFFKDKLGVQPV
jgi:hypothetical protein